ncbi:MAG: hypothetical protein JXR48_02975 [Candidatus Delongbacteria bacterium]|nr:hypothetical protein [Candidatus Delongbacteria bacterium]MBN2833911.1 hypothetical protein [Candidatus Delongbacteria bacterium]
MKILVGFLMLLSATIFAGTGVTNPEIQTENITITKGHSGYHVNSESMNVTISNPENTSALYNSDYNNIENMRVSEITYYHENGVIVQVDITCVTGGTTCLPFVEEAIKDWASSN